MALLEDVTKGPVPMLVGLGIAVAAPTVIPAVAAGLRPVAKALVKSVLTVFDAVKTGIAEAGEQLSDLVEETRAEMTDGARRVGKQAGEAGVTTRNQPHHRRYRG